MQLGDMLIMEGHLSHETLEEAKAALGPAVSARALAEWLISKGACSEEIVIQALGREYRVPVLERIEDQHFDSSLVERLPVDWARSRNVLPIRLNGQLVVVTHDPSNVQDQSDLALLLGEELNVVLASRSAIQEAIERCYFSKEQGADSFLEALPKTSAPEMRDADGEDLLRTGDQAPVAQLVNLILLDALKSGASDIHLEPYSRRISLRFRIDGILYERTPPPKHMEAALISRLKVMGRMDIAEKRMPQDGAARVRVGERELDIRVSTVPVAEGERVVLRLLNRSSTLLPLPDLGLSADMRARFQRLLQEPYGVIWVTGPTGSGKTTTLYAALQELDTKQRNVLTIEDPVEYQLPTIGQMSINPKIGLTFARGLRHILRQDPDVILVGETRDVETAEIVVRASLTGHLVFSTLHTNDALSAPVRLIDMGVEPYLVAASTRAALAQRLVRKLCPHCRKESSITNAQVAVLGARAERFAGKSVWTATGCDQCTAGYKGRIGLFELMEIDGALEEGIRQGGHVRELRAIAQDASMRTLLDDGLDKALTGSTSVEEVLRVVGQGTHAHL